MGNVQCNMRRWYTNARQNHHQPTSKWRDGVQHKPFERNAGLFDERLPKGLDLRDVGMLGSLHWDCSCGTLVRS
uniref:Uncharacterized protein n=1 Tax=Plectus sambesii TaxID=2011161 RepID=A0A914XG94_9BILA